MKTKIYLFFICFLSVSPVLVRALELDTIKTYFSDRSLARVYTVLKGSDVREGLSISYHPNKKVAIEANYKAGKLEGVYKSYYENGNLWQTIGYKNGIEEGFSITYYESGIKQTKETYRLGVLHGTTFEYDEKGVVRREMVYSEGQLNERLVSLIV